MTCVNHCYFVESNRTENIYVLYMSKLSTGVSFCSSQYASPKYSVIIFGNSNFTMSDFCLMYFNISPRHRSRKLGKSRLVSVTTISVLAAVDITNGYNGLFTLFKPRNAMPKYFPSLKYDNVPLILSNRRPIRVG